MCEILDFIKQYPRKENSTFTHIIKGLGSFTLTKNDIKKLYKMINKSSKYYSILEKVADITPLIIDIDLKYKENYTNRQFNNTFLKQLYKFIVNKVKQLFSYESKSVLQMWVMLKKDILPAPQNDYKSKDGIHLLFPQLISHKKNYIRLIDLIYKFKDEYYKIVDETCENPASTDIKDIFDSHPYKNGNWYIYGCGKEEEKNNPYKLEYIFALDESDNIIEQDIDIYLDDTYDIMLKQSVQLNDTKTVEYIGDDNEDESVFKEKSSNNNVNMNLFEFENVDNMNKIVKEDRKYLEGLIGLLSEERSNNYDSWIKTGFCIHNLNRAEYGYKLWIKFSKKSSKFDLNSCNRQWQVMNNKNTGGVGMGSMIHWAAKDSPNDFHKHRCDALESSIIKTVKKEKTCGAHADMADVIYRYYRNEFVCAGLKEDLWYYFNSASGKWKPSEKGHELRKRLSTDIVEVYEYYAFKFKALRGDDPESDEYEKYENYYKNCYVVIINLKNGPYKDKIMKECKEQFYDYEFIDKINTKLNVIGLDNCVIDLQYGSENETNIVVREGIPDDYITISTGYELPIKKDKLPMPYEDMIKYMEENQIDNEFNNLTDEINDFFNKVLPYEDVREYTFRFLSSCLSGEVPDQKFYMWTGSGGNGKSLLIDIVNNTLGDYCKTMDVSYITKERGGSSAASPELEAVKYARFVYLSEPERHDSIYVGKMKQITGGDKMTSRGLFKDTHEFTPQFKMVLQCNDLPSIPNVDGGVARRIEVVNFPSRFRDNPRPTAHNPHEYLKDSTLGNRLKNWNIVFLFKLLGYYSKFKQEGTKAPKSVTEATDVYLTENDLVQKWIKEDIQECENVKSFNTLYQTFTAWCDNEGSNHKKIKKGDVKQALADLQRDSKYGLQYGNKVSDDAPNGTKSWPMFNFCSNEDADDD